MRLLKCLYLKYIGIRKGVDKLTDIEVSPTPIQAFDVAMELTQMYYSSSKATNIEEVDSIFARFYTVANTIHVKHYRELEKLIPENILKKINK
jgi:hypothetical protein